MPRVSGRPLVALVALAALAALTAAATPLAAQVPQAAKPQLLAPSSASAGAELRAALDDGQMWAFTIAGTRARRALEMDQSFGLARAYAAQWTGGPTLGAETERAAREAASGTATEAVLALALREQAAGRTPEARRLFETAAALAPDDSGVALEHALSLGATDRLAAFRRLATRFPGYAAPRMWLAYYLTVSGADTFPATVLSEAIAAATEAVRVAPRSPGAHVALAHALERAGRLGAAKEHLAHARGLGHRDEYLYVLSAEIASREGDIAALRANADSVLDVVAHVGRRGSARQARAMVRLSEGDASGAMADLDRFVRDMEAMGARGQVIAGHRAMAIVAAATRDTAAVRAHTRAAHALDSTSGGAADNAVIVYSLAGMAADARAAFADYERTSGNQPMDVRETNLHRMRGLVLLAERKCADAIVELRQGGVNPYASLGIIEAHRCMGRRREAEAERAAFNARRVFSYYSTAVPIMRYRARRS